MDRFKQVLPLLAVLLLFAGGLQAQEHKESKEGPYLVLEGKASEVSARRVVMDGKQYPVSMFVRVYSAPAGGAEVPMSMVANEGRIDQGRFFLLGGKVEKIVVILMK